MSYKRATALVLLSALTIGGRAFADVPPPTPLPKPASPSSKGPTFEIAAFTDAQSTNERGLQRGGTYDTRNYCFALIDMGDDPRISASITITAYDDPGPSKYAEFPVASLLFNGGRSQNSSGVLVESRVVPLLHPETNFAVKLSPESARMPQGEFHVFLTPLPCSYDFSSTQDVQRINN